MPTQRAGLLPWISHLLMKNGYVSSFRKQALLTRKRLTLTRWASHSTREDSFMCPAPLIWKPQMPSAALELSSHIYRDAVL